MKKYKKIILTGLAITLIASQAFVMAEGKENISRKKAADAPIALSDKYLKEKNYKKAFEHIKEAAQIGDSRAQAKIGLFYKNGLGVEKNIDEAIYWIRLSADQRDPEGLFQLGLIYKEKDDMLEAIYWLSLAYQYGDDDIRKLVDEATI